jgi:hypothetical protein
MMTPILADMHWLPAIIALVPVILFFAALWYLDWETNRRTSDDLKDGGAQR